MRNILFVDDEPNLLKALKRMLRPMHTEWNMCFADSGSAALELLQQQHFDVVVTDMRMPGMDGAELLGHIRDHDPRIARIVLSGQTDKEAALRSTATAHQFLSKPCDAEHLKAAMARACQLRDLMKNEDILRVVSGLRSLPSMPDLFTELSVELQSEDMSLSKVGDIVGRDLALTAKLLQLVNSSFFGLPRHVESVNQAVNFLGGDVVRGLAMSAAVFNQFEGDVDEFQLHRLWQHSHDTAVIAAAVANAESEDKAVVDQSFQAGMLHDIGRLVLATGTPDRYGESIAIADTSRIPIHLAEMQILGCDHSQIGAYLMGLWGLPDPIVEAIAYHHDPKESIADEFSPVTAVHAGNCLAAVLRDSEEHVIEGALADLNANMNDPAKLEMWIRIARKALDLDGDSDDSLAAAS